MLQPTETQLVSAGASALSGISGAPPALVGQLSWRLISDADGTVAIAEGTSAIVEVDDGSDAALRRYERPFTAPLTGGRYLAIWRYMDQEIAQTVVVAASPNAAFATSDDVAKRLVRPLSTAEATTVPFLLNMAATVIADAADYDDGWAASLSPVPQRLRMLSVELVVRALANPSGYSSVRQQVGSYSFEASQAVVGMTLTDAEVLMVRRAVHGRTTDSAVVGSNMAGALDEYWLRKQALRASDPADMVPDAIR